MTALGRVTIAFSAGFKVLEQGFDRFGGDEGDGHIERVGVLKLLADDVSHGVAGMVGDETGRIDTGSVGSAFDQPGHDVLENG